MCKQIEKINYSSWISKIKAALVLDNEALIDHCQQQMFDCEYNKVDIKHFIELILEEDLLIETVAEFLLYTSNTKHLDVLISDFYPVFRQNSEWHHLINVMLHSLSFDSAIKVETLKYLAKFGVDINIKMAAIENFSRRRNIDIPTFLIELLNAEKDEPVRKTIAYALIRQDEVEEKVTNALKTFFHSITNIVEENAEIWEATLVDLVNHEGINKEQFFTEALDAYDYSSQMNLKMNVEKLGELNAELIEVLHEKLNTTDPEKLPETLLIFGVDKNVSNADAAEIAITGFAESLKEVLSEPQGKMDITRRLTITLSHELHGLRHIARELLEERGEIDQAVEYFMKLT